MGVSTDEAIQLLRRFVPAPPSFLELPTSFPVQCSSLSVPSHTVFSLVASAPALSVLACCLCLFALLTTPSNVVDAFKCLHCLQNLKSLIKFYISSVIVGTPRYFFDVGFPSVCCDYVLLPLVRFFIEGKNSTPGLHQTIYPSVSHMSYS